jgi:hypothetical protein
MTFDRRFVSFDVVFCLNAKQGPRGQPVAVLQSTITHPAHAHWDKRSLLLFALARRLALVDDIVTVVLSAVAHRVSGEMYVGRCGWVGY